MPKFITIGYGDQVGYDRTPWPVREAAHEQDAKLRSEGVLMGIAGTLVQVRDPDATHLEHSSDAPSRPCSRSSRRFGYRRENIGFTRC